MAVMEMVIVKLSDNVPRVELFLAFEIKMSQQNGIKINLQGDLLSSKPWDVFWARRKKNLVKFWFK